MHLLPYYYIFSKKESNQRVKESNFKYTNDKLDDHRKVFRVVTDEIKGVKVDIEYISSKTDKHDNIMNRLRG